MAAASNAVEIDPLDPLWDDLQEAERVKRDIEARLEAARAVPAMLDQERQPHILASVIGDADATALLNEIKQRAAENAQQIADLEFALETISTRIDGYNGRLKDAQQKLEQEKAAGLALEAEQHWNRIEQLCDEIRPAYACALGIATQLDQIAHKMRDPSVPTPMWMAYNACPEKLASKLMRCADGATMRQVSRVLQAV